MEEIGKMLEELRKKAYKLFNSNKWMASISEGERCVTIYENGLCCSSMNCFDPEFTTNDIDVAVNYLYPEY